MLPQAARYGSPLQFISPSLAPIAQAYYMALAEEQACVSSSSFVLGNTEVSFLKKWEKKRKPISGYGMFFLLHFFSRKQTPVVV